MDKIAALIAGKRDKNANPKVHLEYFSHFKKSAVLDCLLSDILRSLLHSEELSLLTSPMQEIVVIHYHKKLFNKLIK